MSREYLKDVENACRNGMSAEEVQNYFNEILKANNKKSKEFLKVTAIGIARAKNKAKAINNNPVVNQTIVQPQPNINMNLNSNVQSNGFQYQYVNRDS